MQGKQVKPTSFVFLFSFPVDAIRCGVGVE